MLREDRLLMGWSVVNNFVGQCFFTVSYLYRILVHGSLGGKKLPQNVQQ